MSNLDNQAVVSIDMERCFFPESEGRRLHAEGFGALAVTGAESTIFTANWVSETAHRLGIEIVHTLDKHPAPTAEGMTAHFSDEPNYRDSWPVHGVDGTPGSLLHPDLDIALFPEWSTEFIKGDVVAATPEDDTSYTAALAHRRGDTLLLPDYLRERGKSALTIVGLALGDGEEQPLCVDSSAIDFVHQGFDVTVITDAVEAVLPENRATCLRRMGDMGIRLLTASEWVKSVNNLHREA